MTMIRLRMRHHPMGAGTRKRSLLTVYRATKTYSYLIQFLPSFRNTSTNDSPHPSLTPAQILALPHDDVKDVEDPVGGPVGVEDAVEDCMRGEGGREVVCVGGGGRG